MDLIFAIGLTKDQVFGPLALIFLAIEEQHMPSMSDLYRRLLSVGYCFVA